jgi:hypothetical protein
MLKIEVTFQAKTLEVVHSNNLPSFEQFNALVTSKFQFEDTKEPFSYQYRDDEGDTLKITCDLELKEAYRYSLKTSNQSLHLKILEPASLRVKMIKNEEPALILERVPMNEKPHFEPPQMHAPFLSFSQMMNAKPDLDATIPQMFQNLMDQNAIQVAPEISQSFKKLVASIPPEPLAEFTRSVLSSSSINQSLISSSISGSKLPPVVHQAICDSCKQQIVGIRYHCMMCEDFDLCQACELKEGVHDEDHVFVKIKKNAPPPSKVVPANPSSPKQPAKAEEIKRDLKSEEKSLETNVKVAPPPSAQPSENDRLADALAKLHEMGFTDRQKNIQLLEKHNGNVINVVQEYINLTV